MKSLLSISAFLFLYGYTAAQTSIVATNPLAKAVMQGNFDPQLFNPTPADNPKVVVHTINAALSRTDSLKSYIIRLASFHNRNSGSDTVSNVRGFGAARRWVFSKFEQFSRESNGRLIPSYLQFNFNICGVTQHRNIFAVLPGRDTSDHGIIVIEGHMDSRCEDECDPDCLAEGVEDNASGTALVIELARVMSRFSFNKTLVFLVTTGEEQGLVGARAFALYCKQQQIPVKAVLNNDVIGGIICGKTSSPPSCPSENAIDSTQVRLFSSGFANSPHKQLARYIKLQYEQELRPIAKVQMRISIMSAEDRTGRGGDHIPFRENGFPAMRFTSANEHGHGAPNATYTDRQHSFRDILGEDTDGDSVIDSFFVNFNYLARNTVINGVAAGMIAQGVKMAQFDAVQTGSSIRVKIRTPLLYDRYLVALRTNTNEFDTIYQLNTGDEIEFSKPAYQFAYISVAAVDSNEVESCFSAETRLLITGTEEIEEEGNSGIELLQNRPNPFDEATFIPFVIHKNFGKADAFVKISGMDGREIHRIPVELKVGYNEVLYEHGYGVVGAYVYSFWVDGKLLDSRTMVFAN